MSYPSIPDYSRLARELELYAQLKHEYGAKGVPAVLRKAEKCMQSALKELRQLKVDQTLAAREPDDLDRICALRPGGPRRLWHGVDKTRYPDRLAGALLGRMAGCTLGAPVEFWEIGRMAQLAADNGDPFPPVDYWKSVPDPDGLRYRLSPKSSYTRGSMDGVPVDDDIAYTLLGLLVVEDHGPSFSVEDNGRAWLKYLPYACSAEDVALNNLKKGIPARLAAETDNPYCEWIGADIRSDPWGYMAPGWPEAAARMAYHDAYLSHRRQGIYGAMYFSAAIAAAFAVDDPVEAFKIGLTEIPKSCAMSKAVRWALKVAPEITDYRKARDAAEEKFEGMHRVHTIKNACLTIWGVIIGGADFTRVIGETVAMGLDNDCTAATAGSIAGAVMGKSAIPEHWYRGFDNKVHSYLIGRRTFSITGLIRRFIRQASRVHESMAPHDKTRGESRNANNQH